MSKNKDRYKNDLKNSDFDEFKPVEFERFHKETDTKRKDKSNKPKRGGKRGN